MACQFYKDPEAKKDYTIDWSTFLGADTISTSAWGDVSPVTSSPLVKSSPSNTTTTTTVWLDDGLAGTTYTVVNHIVTAAGREEDQMLVLTINQN